LRGRGEWKRSIPVWHVSAGGRKEKVMAKKKQEVSSNTPCRYKCRRYSNTPLPASEAAVAGRGGTPKPPAWEFLYGHDVEMPDWDVYLVDMDADSRP